ncbi:MAG: SAM-dependent methyltransferase [Rhizobiaceae bacterium]
MQYSRELIERSYRRLDEARHPKLQSMSRDEMYDHGRIMAPGGLYLASIMADALDLKPGAHVLDLGCGRAQSSIFLASQFGVKVSSVDLWISAKERSASVKQAGLKRRIQNYQTDIRRGLPFGPGSFDTIFCLQAFHTFATTPRVIEYLTRLLKPGGQICIAQTCFDVEIDPLPSIFGQTDGWDARYDTYHSPRWWYDLFRSQGGLDVHACHELLDGDIYWEDDVLYRGDRDGWTPKYLSHSSWLFAHILHGRLAQPKLTHFILVASRPSS